MKNVSGGKKIERVKNKKVCTRRRTVKSDSRATRSSDAAKTKKVTDGRDVKGRRPADGRGRQHGGRVKIDVGRVRGRPIAVQLTVGTATASATLATAAVRFV